MNEELEALTRETIKDLVWGSTQPVFVDVWGAECKPCLLLAPAYAHLAERFISQARFLKLEAPKNRMACVDLKVMTLPTFLHFNHGEEVSRLSGEGLTDGDLTEWVEAVF